MKLTREQRVMLFAGEHPRISFPASEPCPARVGEVVHLSREVEIEVLAIVETKTKDWRIDYVLRDMRANLMRRVPPVHDAKREAERGDPGPEELRRAARESAVTHSPLEAVPGDGGELVEPEVQAEFTMEAIQKDLSRQEGTKRQAGLEAELARVRSECRRRGVDTTRLDASIKKRIRAYERRLAEAA